MNPEAKIKMPDMSLARAYVQMTRNWFQNVEYTKLVYIISILHYIIIPHTTHPEAKIKMRLF